MSHGQPSFVFQSGKASGNDSSGVIDLTMDDEESGTTQGTERFWEEKTVMPCPLVMMGDVL